MQETEYTECAVADSRQHSVLNCSRGGGDKRASYEMKRPTVK